MLLILNLWWKFHEEEHSKSCVEIPKIPRAFHKFFFSLIFFNNFSFFYLKAPLALWFFRTHTRTLWGGLNFFLSTSAGECATENVCSMGIKIYFFPPCISLFLFAPCHRPKELSFCCFFFFRKYIYWWNYFYLFIDFFVFFSLLLCFFFSLPSNRHFFHLFFNYTTLTVCFYISFCTSAFLRASLEIFLIRSHYSYAFFDKKVSYKTFIWGYKQKNVINKWALDDDNLS